MCEDKLRSEGVSGEASVRRGCIMSFSWSLNIVRELMVGDTGTHGRQGMHGR